MTDTLTRYLALGYLLAAPAMYAAPNITVVNPEAVGLLPRTQTIDVNTNAGFNYSPSGVTKWLDITANHNVAVCWSDAGTAATDFKSMNVVWTLYNSNGVNLIPPTLITNKTAAPGATTQINNWLSLFRPDGRSTPGNVGGVPRIRANRFGNGFLFGVRADRLGLEDPAFLPINTDLSSGGNPITTLSVNSGFPVAQLINNDGTPGGGIVTGVSDEEADATGNIFGHGMAYLSNGNIVMASESRQDQEFVNRFGSTTPNRHVVYRVVTPAGVVVKSTSLVSETLDRTELFGYGIGVTANGFAIRFSYRPRHDGSGRTSGTIRLFDNDGNPVSGDINQSDAVGEYLGTGPNNPTGGNGGRGDSVGFGGNQTDAYVNACIGAPEGVFGPVYVTVYNADGTVRYHRAVADEGETNYAEQVDAAIAPDGRVVVVMDDRTAAGITGQTNRLILGRIFDRDGKAMGPCFYVSERENPFIATKDSLRPKVAWRDNMIAVAWGSLNSPAASSVVSTRMFEVTRVVNPEHVGLSPRTATIDVNNANPAFNYGTLGNQWVDIANNHSVAVTWGDGGTASTDFVSQNSVWTLYDANGNPLIPQTVITNKTGAVGPTTLTNTALAFFRPDGSSTPGNTSGNARIRANRFGDGILFGTRAERLGLEIPAFLAINQDANNPLITPTSSGSGFPAVQLLNNNGTPGSGILTGTDDDQAQPAGQVTPQGMEYLANGNIVIVMESRQDQDFVNRFGAAAPNRHAVYRVLGPTGAVVKDYSLVSSTLDRTEMVGFMVGVTRNGFAIRFSYRPRHDGSGRTSGTIRLFDNSGNPLSDDINQSDAVGEYLGTGPNNPTGGNGGRGDSVGFHGNGVDAYVNVCIGDQEGVSGPAYITVYNSDGTIRYHRPVSETGETNSAKFPDAAIHADGRVVVVFDDVITSSLTGNNNRLIVGKMFDPKGNSMGPLFYVSERETPFNTVKENVEPKIVWRDNLIAVVWKSLSSPNTSKAVVGLRVFNDVATTPPNLSIAKSGGNAVMTWPATPAGYTLRSKASVSAATWETNSPAPVFGNGGAVYQVTEPIGSSSRIYQLIR